MATIKEVLNIAVCGASSALGTGFKGCRYYFGKTKELWFTPRGFVYDETKVFDKTYFEELQADGKLIVVKTIQGFTDNSSDDQIETLENGVKRVTTLGLYEFLVNFTNGIYFHAALNSLNSFGAYDITSIDTEGNIIATEGIGGFKGFSLGMLQTQRLTWATDAAGQREGLAYQLTERAELDDNYAFIQKQSTCDPRTLEGVNEVDLEYVNAPAAADTTLTIKATLRQSGEVLSGLAFGDFLVKKDGVTANPTAGDDSVTPGTYLLTVAALTAGVLDSSLYDNTNSRIGVVSDGALYKSSTITATVA